MMKSIKIKYVFFAFLIAIAGCRKDEKMEGPTIIDPTGDPTIEVVSGVTGLVVDENGNPVSSAAVMVYNREVKTDENGIFYVNNQGLNENNSTIHVEKSGYFDGFKSFIPSLGKKSFVQLKMIKRGTASQISSEMGGVVNIEGGAELTLPANGVVLKDGGGNYSGEIYAYTHWYNPTDPDIVVSMPGNLSGIASDGSEVQLATYGMIAVELESPDGIPLQLATESKAKLKFPQSGNVALPNTIPLWSFDESDVVWIQEGEAILVDGHYEAEVSHFSFWNCDAPYPLVRIEGRLLYNGSPVANFPVTIQLDDLISGYGHTDGEGYFRGKIPKDELLTMIIRHCDQTIVSKEIGPFGTDANIEDVNVDLLNFVTEIKGRMVDCFDNPLQSAYGLLKSGDKVVQVITPLASGPDVDGSFLSVLAACQNGNYTVQFFDPENIKTSEVYDISPDVEVHELNDVRICDDLDEFIQYSVDGDLAPLIEDANVFISNEEKIIIRGFIPNSFESFDIDIFATSIGLYNPSSVSIHDELGPNNPELQMMCGDHISNAIGCDQFSVNITNFGEYISGSFGGTVVAYNDSLFNGSLEFEEYSINGSFRVKIDDNFTTGEISGQFWIDENNNNTREDNEDLSLAFQSVSLFKVGGFSAELFPSFLSGFSRYYKFTNLLPGTYKVLAYNNSGYEVVVKDVGNDDVDCDFMDVGNRFESDERVITTNENFENVDLGYQLPSSVNCSNLYFLGCAPNIFVSTSISGGVPPYTVTLSDGQSMVVDQNPSFVVSNGGDYIIEVEDAVGNSCMTSGFVHEYRNTVQGIVWRDVDGGTPNVFDAGDIRLSEIKVSLRMENGSTVADSQSDNSGNFRIQNIPPGQYYIEIDVPNGLQIVDKDLSSDLGNYINTDTNRSDVFEIDGCNTFTRINAGLREI